MAIKQMMRYIGKRELVAWTILTGVFIALIAFHFSVWGFLTAAVLFIGYISWNSSAFFIARGDVSGKTIAAWVWPVGLATIKAAVGLGVAWLIFWLAHRLFGT